MAIERGVDVIAHSVRDLDIDAATIAEMKRRNVALIPTLVRDRSVFIYENLPDFFKDPFFLRGMPTYKREVDLLSDPASAAADAHERAIIQASKPQLAQGIKNLKPLLDAGIPIAMGSDSGSIPDRNLGPVGRLQRARRARNDGGCGDDADAGARLGDEHRRARDEDRRRGLAGRQASGRTWSC